MLSSSKRIPAALLVLALMAGSPAICAGWMSAPEARMACCTDDGRCPMQASESHAGSHGRVTQAEADRCCALSEDDATPSPSTLGSLGALALALNRIPVLIAAPEVHADLPRTPVPLPGRGVPKHLLLSVFLL